MRPALEELRRRLAEHGYEQSVIDEIIKQIEPFVGGYAPAESNFRSQNSFNLKLEPLKLFWTTARRLRLTLHLTMLINKGFLGYAENATVLRIKKDTLTHFQWERT